MANYSTSSHTLHFDSLYDKLIVKNSSNQQVAEFDLPVYTVLSGTCSSNNSLQVSVSGGNYVINSGNCSSGARAGFEPGQSSVAFNGTKLDGGTIIDLRDLDNPVIENWQWDLEATTVGLQRLNQTGVPYTLIICGNPS